MKIKEFEFEKIGNGVEIVKYENRSITIPSEINGKKVINIKESTFEKKDLISVSIPKNIIYLAENAFDNNVEIIRE